MFCVEVSGAFLVQKEMSKSHLMTARENTWNDERRLFSLLHTGYIHFNRTCSFFISVGKWQLFKICSALTIRVLKFWNHSIIHGVRKRLSLSFYHSNCNAESQKSRRRLGNADYKFFARIYKIYHIIVNNNLRVNDF